MALEVQNVCFADAGNPMQTFYPSRKDILLYHKPGFLIRGKYARGLFLFCCKLYALLLHNLCNFEHFTEFYGVTIRYSDLAAELNRFHTCQQMGIYQNLIMKHSILAAIV